MQIKKELRKKFRLKRKEIKNKEFLDNKIADNFLSSSIYKKAETILCYFSLDDEISTNKILNSAFKDNKKVAVPFCEDLNGKMNFYYINSLNDVVLGSFGIMEPNKEICKKVDNFENSICVVPAFSFDKLGFRLGYGKGYYDRFLENFISISVGLCYNSFLSDELPINQYDKQVNYIITENDLIKIERSR